MEKFRKFADPQTGINVFLPAYSNHKTTIIDRLLHSVLYENYSRLWEFY